MKSIILVEGKDDKAFIESLIDNLTIEVDEIEVNTDMKGLSKEGLINALGLARNKVRKFGVTKLGIVIDKDNKDFQSCLAFINECVSAVFGVAISGESGQIDFDYEGLNMSISCHFIGIDEIGELEGYLMKITKSSTKFADCLKEWRNCVGVENITDKDFRKLWVHYYVKWDTSTDHERTQGSRYCTVEYSLKNKKEHWDLESNVLKPVRDYLQTLIT